MKSMLRNEFEHFTPKLWAIEIHGMPEITIHVLNVIRFLALETRTYVNLNEDERNEVDQLVTDAISFLKSTDLYNSSYGG
jgi:hypothetical protein